MNTERILEIIENTKNSSLKMLDLSETNLTEIPMEVFELNELRVLRLRKNIISKIPKEIKKLKNLVELNLTNNIIEEIPIETYELKNLEVLFLGKNNITNFPDGISSLKNIRVVNLRDNRITQIPADIGELENLRTLFLKDNLITHLPKSFGKLITLKEAYLSNNPFIYPPQDVISKGLMRIILYILLDGSNEESSAFSFKVPKEIRTAVKQYLTYFAEYVEVAKGKNITFEVKTVEEGILIEADSQDLNELNDYFNEYLGFVKNNIDDLAPRIEVTLEEPKKDLFILELKSQVQHFKQQIEFKNFQLKYLEKQVNNFQDLLLAQISRPIPIVINALASSSSTSEATSEQHTSVITEIKLELPILQNEILNLRSNLPEDISKNLEDELKYIDEELLANDVKDVEDLDKKPLKRIGRLFEQINDEDSELNKIVKGSAKFKNALQKLGKSYNKIAQWTALPVIPDLLLEL
jgi:Leucine-rich repeat (LRR) protein